MRILLTGATGYIGRRLKDRLLSRADLTLRLLVRNRNKVRPATAARVEIIEGDTFNTRVLAEACRDIDVAYYLIHSMKAQGGDYQDLDRTSAENFRDACIAAGVKRIVYLGGLGVKETASRHLLSRIETGEILSKRPESIRTIWLRAGVIIGAGSASFEIIRNLVEKLPVLVTPLWVRTVTQPIGVADVLRYLEGALTVMTTTNLIVDIGAPPMTFADMLLEAAKVMGLKRHIVPVPVLSPRLSSYWLILFTPIPYRMAAALIEGLKSETVAQNDNAARFFPDIPPSPYAKAVAAAMAEIEQEEVLSRWCDSSGEVTCDLHGQDDPSGAVLHDRRERICGGVADNALFQAACELGGAGGWGRYNFLWRLRGLLDKLLGGYGLNRGRRLQCHLRVGDALDFWKVVDVRPGKRLLLAAQMKLPGKAWLEFAIDRETLTQTAHFLPKGVWGRVYWYTVLPFHHLVFGDLADRVVRRARRLTQEASSRA